MSTIATTIDPTTLEAVTSTVKPARRKPARPKATPAEPTMAELEAALRKEWDDAITVESGAKNVLDAAKIAWENTRVLRCRVAYRAAMLKPTADGKPNLLNAARVLGTDPTDTPAERTKAAKNRKNSVRNYLNAGIALGEAGFGHRITEPDQDERDIVRDAFKAGNARPADTNGGGTGEGDVEGGGVPTPPANDDPVTQADVVSTLETAMSTLKRFTRDQGFSAVVAENLGAALAEMSALIESHRVDGGE